MDCVPCCPQCTARHWVELYRTSTLLYTIVEYVNGEPVSIDPNIITAHVKCLECGKEFDIRKKNGVYLND